MLETYLAAYSEHVEIKALISISPYFIKFKDNLIILSPNFSSSFLFNKIDSQIIMGTHPNLFQTMSKFMWVKASIDASASALLLTCLFGITHKTAIHLTFAIYTRKARLEVFDQCKSIILNQLISDNLINSDFYENDYIEIPLSTKRS